MKKSIFTLLLVGLMLGLQAKPVDVNMAKSLGIKFMNANTNIKSAQADLVYTAYADNDQACFYVFSMQPKGFVIVSADDRARPILGYSTESGFRADEIADGLQSFFKNYRAGFSQIFERDEPRTEEAIHDWDRLATTGLINDAKITREVPQLLTCTWNQSALYNDLCPVDSLGSNNHVYAGCVATAMSQIMYYWQWPQNGLGTHIYSCYPYGDFYVDYTTANYRFDLMPDFLDWTSTPEEIYEVAKLQYHAGVSVDMGYSPEGSGAMSQSVPSALIDHFRYDPLSVYYDAQMWHTNSEWNSLLRENLDLSMPLYYSASGSDGGHAFVCDGYDDNNMFHFNWGWQGFDNGYYAINGFYLSNYSFPDYHAAVFGIYPDADYCFRPFPVTDLQVEAVAEGTNRLTFVAPSMTLCEFPLDQIDSIIIVRNNRVVHTEVGVTSGAQVSFDDHDALGICHYAVYPYAYEYIGDAVKDTILNGPTCELTFHLHDSEGDGWITKPISIVDSRGYAITRLGLAEGSETIMKVEVPSDDELSIYWAYGMGSDVESSFEVYDWNNNLLYASDGFLFVGELCRFVSDCGDDVVEIEEDKMRVYPNPTCAMMTVDGVDVAQIEVFNVLGQLIGHYSNNEIDLTGFEDGVYFLRVTTVDGQVMLEKVMKR